MTRRSHVRATAVAAAACLLIFGAPVSVYAQARPAAPTHATGSFDVQVKPLGAAEAPTGGPAIGRMSLDKQIHGDLEGTGKGVMLTAGTDAGVGAYAALEQFSGTVRGRKGSFLLVHSGTMTRDAQHLNITIVPGSGTDQLAGIAGTLDIKIVDGKHFYDLEYTLPGAP